ncbi:MAG TPA: polysaccharide deacetylase family protein [Chitinophagaceae bacterium]|nr:polysaccharide deacetylase family protein [Chitinophagaceae bacterium]
MKKLSFTAIILTLAVISCSQNGSDKKIANKEKTSGKDTVKNETGSQVSATVADLSSILALKQIPVLCYHHIRDPKPGQSESMKSYSVSPSQFAEQMKALKDSGYETILPDQLYNYLLYSGKLPAKSILLTFDDTDEEQYSIGWQEMKKYGFKGVFFIMTISIDKPRYMSKQQLKDLSDSGNAVESHTWDHHMVTRYSGDDWNKQLIQPRKTIENITGKSADYFAYPYGLWNQAAIPELRKAGFKMAFILSTKRDSTEPLYTIRRMIVPGQWSIPGMFRAMKSTFKL